MVTAAIEGATARVEAAAAEEATAVATEVATEVVEAAVAAWAGAVEVDEAQAAKPLAADEWGRTAEGPPENERMSASKKESAQRGQDLPKGRSSHRWAGRPGRRKDGPLSGFQSRTPGMCRRCWTRLPRTTSACSRSPTSAVTKWSAMAVEAAFQSHPPLVAEPPKLDLAARPRR